MTEFERMQAFSYLDGVADGLNESRKDIISELEKIKAEIDEQKLDVDLDIGNEIIYNNAISDVLQILDKHIEELKGENK